MVPSGFQEERSFIFRSSRIGIAPRMSNDFNSKQIPGRFCIPSSCHGKVPQVLIANRLDCFVSSDSQKQKARKDSHHLTKLKWRSAQYDCTTYRQVGPFGSQTPLIPIFFSHTDNNPQESSNIFSMRGFVFIVGLLLIGVSVGCSFFILPASEEKLNSNQSYWFHYEAARRGGFLIGTDSTGKSNVKMCAEPAPDVALARTVEVIAKGAYQGATAQAQAKLSEQLAQLAGRTETVLILRESLFRLCELSINSQSSPTELQALYKMVVEAAVDLAKTELTKAETERMKTLDSLSPATRQQFAP